MIEVLAHTITLYTWFFVLSLCLSASVGFVFAVLITKDTQ